MSAKELSCFHNSKRGETTNKNLADIWCLVFSHWLMQRKSQNFSFFSNLTLATLLNILLIQIVISWFLLQNAWIRHFFFNIHFFFSLSKKSSNCSTTHSNILSLLLDSTFDPPSWLACWKKNAKIKFLSKSISLSFQKGREKGSL